MTDSDFPQVYEDVIGSVAAGLIDLGFAVSIEYKKIREDAYNIIFVPWGFLLPQNAKMYETFQQHADRCILFNLEQV